MAVIRLGIKASETKKLQRWRHSPEFLWREAGEWPQQFPAVLEDLLDSDEGVKKKRVRCSDCAEQFLEQYVPALFIMEPIA